jgi:hypothetical protein
MRFCAPTAYSTSSVMFQPADQNAPPSAFRRPGRFRHSPPTPRFLGAPAPGVHPSKLFPLTWSRHAFAVRTRFSPRANLAVHLRFLPAYCCLPCKPTKQIAVRHGSLSFQAFLPLRIRQLPVGIKPQAIRCSPGVCLSKDFALPATSSLSRTFRSRTCMTGCFHPRVLLSLSVFPCEEVSFPPASIEIASNRSRSGCCPS